MPPTIPFTWGYSINVCWMLLFNDSPTLLDHTPGAPPYSPIMHYHHHPPLEPYVKNDCAPVPSTEVIQDSLQQESAELEKNWHLSLATGRSIGGNPTGNCLSLCLCKYVSLCHCYIPLNEVGVVAAIHGARKTAFPNNNNTSIASCLISYRFQ